MPDEPNNGVDTEQRFNSIEATLRMLAEQNNRILGIAGDLSRVPAAPVREEPLPQITGTEFLDKPAEVIDSLVSRQVGKIKGDIQKQLEPFTVFMAQQGRERAANQYIAQMEGNPAAYPHIKNPNVRNMVFEAITNAPEINPSFVHAVYMTAVGHAFSTGQLVPGSTKPEDQPKKRDLETVPAHLRPTASNNSGGPSVDTLPELDENQKRIARERGWSHARAAYMYQLISPEAYKKLEPNGKLIDFGN